MSHSAPPVLTVRYDGSQRTFAAGHDVVVGRDLRADMRITHPLISRAHLLLRFDQGRWLAIDNGSLNGTYVNGRRVPVIDIHDGQVINIGNPDGPQLSFEIGRHAGIAGRPPQTASMPLAKASAPARPAPPPQQPRPAPGPRPPAPIGPGPSRPYPGAPPPPGYQGSGGRRPPSYPAGPPPAAPPPMRQPAAPVASAPPVNFQPKTEMAPPAISKPPEVGNLATKMIQAILPGSLTPDKPPGSATIGRANDNDIVIQDVLASRHHAFLVDSPLGTEIRDAHSVNGTFVNGVRVGSAVLSEGDVITIGNIDLVFNDGNLIRRTEAATRSGGLEVNGVHFKIDGKELLDGISLTARPGTLTAIIGGSGAGKTTLSRLIAGYTRPSSGTVTFEGHNIHSEYATMRSRIGMVPQDDVVHRQLTVNQALGYAAELRLPPDTSKEERAQVVAQVLEELDLTKHADTRVDKLSGGQRKRASVALELLTQPSLLLLDEPTSGLDPALDRQVMLMLRQLADAGRVVLVVTHSVSYLDVCDQILLIAPGGKTAFNGPPSQVGEMLGTTNWADIFANVGADPDEANRRFLERKGDRQSQALARESPADLGEPVHSDVLRQLSTIARRQIRLVISDRGYTVFLAVLPFLMGALSLTVKGPTPGLGPAAPNGPAPTEPQYIMVLLNIGAVFMGTALTIRDLIGERPIFRREQAVGLSTTAYLLAKVAVFSIFATVQAAISVTIVRLGKGAPTAHPPFFDNSTFSLFLTVAATCVASAMFGMLLSAVAQTSEQIMPLLVVSIMSQLVLCGGMGIPVTGRLGLNQLSFLTPARWGFAAGASSIDFPSLVKVPQIPTYDRWWQHSKHIYVFDMAMLTALSIAYTTYIRWHIRLRR
ncbi:MAG TPA: FHA domain-containing protein [Mycobacterium sp.]|uniref:FHA domain-containing protein n=1 Tax=Mycobacterium sp. TaxID=1785 RepID=UPI002F415738